MERTGSKIRFLLKKTHDCHQYHRGALTIETDRDYPLLLATILLRMRIDADEGLTERKGSKIRFLLKKTHDCHQYHRGALRIETDTDYPLILVTILLRPRNDANQGLTERTGSKIRFLSKKTHDCHRYHRGALRRETDRDYPLILVSILLRPRIDADEGLMERTGSKIRFLSKKTHDCHQYHRGALRIETDRAYPLILVTIR